MNDSLTKRDSVSESCGHRDAVSPLPWRVENVNQTYHVDAADGGFVALFVSEANAALIVEAVNAIDATRKLQRTLLGWSMERDRLRDLVRRLVADWEPFINDGPLSYPDEKRRAATIREAHEVLVEGEP